MTRSVAFACALAVFAAPLSSIAAQPASKPTPKPMSMKTPVAGTHKYPCSIVHGKKICAVGGVAPSHGIVSPMTTNKH
jgi:hypothetical protein